MTKQSTRHSWEKVRIHHYVCRKCGVVKHTMTDGRVFWATYFRADQLTVGRTLPCDATWPTDWGKEMARAEVSAGGAQ